MGKPTIADLERQIEQAEKACEAAGVECQPWRTGDNPLSIKWWGLIQERLKLGHRK